MNPNPESQLPDLSRREVLRRTLLGSLALGAASHTSEARATSIPAPPEPFVPENDYPYFGAQPPAQESGR